MAEQVRFVCHFISDPLYGTKQCHSLNGCGSFKSEHSLRDHVRRHHNLIPPEDELRALHDKPKYQQSACCHHWLNQREHTSHIERPDLCEGPKQGWHPALTEEQLNDGAWLFAVFRLARLAKRGQTPQKGRKRKATESNIEAEARPGPSARARTSSPAWPEAPAEGVPGPSRWARTSSPAQEDEPAQVSVWTPNVHDLAPELSQEDIDGILMEDSLGFWNLDWSTEALEEELGQK